MDNQHQNDEVQDSRIESTETKPVSQQQQQEHQPFESEPEPSLEELRQRVLEQRGSTTVLPDGWEDDSNQIGVDQELQEEVLVVENEDGDGNQNDKIQQEKPTVIDETITPQVSQQVEKQREAMDDTQDLKHTSVKQSEQGSTPDPQVVQVQHQVDSIPSTSASIQADSEKTSDQKIDETAKNKEASAVEQEVVPDDFRSVNFYPVETFHQITRGIKLMLIFQSFILYFPLTQPCSAPSDQRK